MFLKRKKTKRIILFVFISGLLLTVCLVLIIFSGNSDSDAPISLTDRFLEDLLNSRVDAATEYLSSDAKIAANVTCPDNSIVGCAKGLISTSWGKFEHVEFRYGEPQSNSTWSLLMYTTWSNLKGFGGDFVPIVVTTKIENGRWVVTGWRGFTVAYNDVDEMGLLRGKLHTNEFPKNELLQATSSR